MSPSRWNRRCRHTGDTPALRFSTARASSLADTTIHRDTTKGKAVCAGGHCWCSWWDIRSGWKGGGGWGLRLRRTAAARRKGAREPKLLPNGCELLCSGGAGMEAVYRAAE
jgi:hypothetical protein